MERVGIDSFDIEFKSALRNLKSAILLSAMLFALCVPASAQQPAKVPRIGYLTGSPLSANPAPHRGIPTRSARAWLRRREKHCH